MMEFKSAMGFRQRGTKSPAGALDARFVMNRRTLGVVYALIVTVAGVMRGGEIAPPAGATPAERGLWLLLNRPFMDNELSNEDFAEIWRIWPEPLRSQAEKASPEERRRMAFRRYGHIEMAGREMPMGFADDGNGGWVMNCLVCHGGKVEGQAMPGLPNSHLAFQTWAQDVVEYRVAIEHEQRSQLAPRLAIPLSRSNGTTNAQVFSVALTSLRTSDLELKSPAERKLPKLLHHDLDAPPFWHLKKKKMIYIDGYVEKSSRVVMQFVMLPDIKGETLRSWDADFKDILAFAESVEAPKYRGQIDAALADVGKLVFADHCAACHGTYGPGGQYPEKTIPIDDIGTDRRRLAGIPIEHRRFFAQGWVSEEGEVQVVENPVGYVAPPLDGIWASAPYFHNGSVPTLWHVLHPESRPAVWERTEDGYDHQRMGLEVEEMESVPASGKASDPRVYFDTKQLGKSAAGHDYPSELSEDERRQVLEYLKTL
jgi:cytochrome c553